MPVTPRRAQVAPNTTTRAARPVHARPTTLAVQELPQQVILGRRSRLDDARSPGANLLHTIEELLRDERLVQAADRAVLAPQPADVAAVGAVQKHLAHRVLAEGPPLRRPSAAGVQPCSERAVRLLPTRVALEQLAHHGCPFRIGDRETAVGVTAIAPGQRTHEVPLSRLLAQPGARPERERCSLAILTSASPPTTRSLGESSMRPRTSPDVKSSTSTPRATSNPQGCRERANADEPPVHATAASPDGRRSGPAPMPAPMAAPMPAP